MGSRRLLLRLYSRVALSWWSRSTASSLACRSIFRPIYMLGPSSDQYIRMSENPEVKIIKREAAELGSKAKKAIARISSLIGEVFIDLIRPRSDKIDVALVLTTVQKVVNSKFIPKDHEFDIALGLLLDVYRKVGTIFEGEQRRDLEDLIETIRTIIRSSDSKQWKARG